MKLELRIEQEFAISATAAVTLQEAELDHEPL